MPKIKKRIVFYLGGYDPRGARNYYNLYKTEALKNNTIDEMQIQISSRRKTSKILQTWDIQSKIKNEETHTQYHFLVWDDIFRKTWKRSPLQLLKDIFTYLRYYLFSFLILRSMKLSASALQSLWYPLFYLLISFAIAYALFWGLEFFFSQTLHFSLLYLLSAIFISLWLYFSMKLSYKVAVLWLFKALCFYANYIKKEDKILSTRTEDFAVLITQALKNVKKNQIDEILLISHSAGTILLIDVLANILKSFQPDSAILKSLSIMSIGHFIPLVSFQKEAIHYRKKMKIISQYSMTWLDYTSAIDNLTFYMADYFLESGIQRNILKIEHLSPRFHTLYTKEHYAKIRRDIHLAHFLYLMSPEKLGTYNYFRITAGNASLSSFSKGKI